MAVLLRDMGVPTRMVEGFLPGAVDPHTGIETIPFSSAHAWVEVYFPGFGWVMFDPTGGNLRQIAPLPSRPPVAAGSPRLHLEYTAQTVDGVAPTPADMAKVASILRSRIDAMGVADPTVTTHDLVLVVELPGVTDAADVETVGRMLGHTGQVEFVPLGDTPVGVGDPIDLTKDPPLFGGDQIASATVAADQNGAPAVDFLLKPDGTRLFADYTANHVGSYFAITMDGDVLSAPVIQNAIPNGDIEISGGDVSGLDAMHAHGLVALIGSGKLPVPLVLTSSSLIGLASPAASTP
jgi:preprotein translocase subunit SecD